ncbi:hypothetical protein P7C70_g1602, partial [Phenoliferia sp. Uapishka_3]
MQAAMYYGAQDIRIEDVPVPEPKPNQVQIKIACSDLHEYEGVLSLSDNAQHHGNIATADDLLQRAQFSALHSQFLMPSQTQPYRLFLVTNRNNGMDTSPKFSFPMLQLQTACQTLGWIGLSGGGGGLSEFICVDEGYIHALPDNVTMKEGAMVEPLAVAMHAVQASKMQAGDTALVVGAGPIGCFVIKTLIALGASRVIVSEPSTIRRKMATRAGAHHVYNPMESGIIEECQILTGGADVGVHVAFECAGVQAGLDQALGALRTGGVCVNVAIWRQVKLPSNSSVDV